MGSWVGAFLGHPHFYLEHLLGHGLLVFPEPIAFFECFGDILGGFYRGILGMFASHPGGCPADRPMVSKLIGLPAFT